MLRVIKILVTASLIEEGDGTWKKLEGSGLRFNASNHPDSHGSNFSVET